MATSLTKELRTGPGGPQLSCGRGFGPPFSGGGGGPDEFVPNCLLNTLSSARLATGVTVTLLLQDYAAECWALSFGPGPNSNAAFSLLFGGAAADGVQFDLNDADAGAFGYSVYARSIPPGGSIVGTHIALTPGWHHYAVNYDRSNLATLYIDGAVADTVAINAGVADNKDENREIQVGAMSTDTTPVAIGPMAYHINTLLTGAQLRNSWVNRYVQNLAATYGLWDPRYLIGQTGWDSDPTHFAARLYSQGINTDQQVPIPFATPEGTNGTVFVPDLSGNGRHLNVTTRTAYTTSAQAHVSFGTDPFWEKT